jgi:hypothetical protein
MGTLRTALFAATILTLTALAGTAEAVNPRNTAKLSTTNKAVKVLQANIGNSNLNCGLASSWKLCLQNVENAVRDRIAQINPDIALLNELHPDWLCRGNAATWPNGVCEGYKTRAVRDQVRRVLGSNYTIVCDPWHGWDCIGIKKTIGGLPATVANDAAGRSCPAGYLCGYGVDFSNGDPTATNKEPLFREYAATYNSSSEDGGFHMMYVDATINGVSMRIINGHPQSGGSGSGAKEQARSAQISGAFSQWAAGHPRVLAGGDINTDVYTWNSDVSVLTWRNFVDNYDANGNRTVDRTYWYHSGVAENGGTWTPKFTFSYVVNRRYDHVVSNFMYGRCTTMNSTSSTSPAYRLTGPITGMDHFANLCTLYYP